MWGKEKGQHKNTVRKDLAKLDESGLTVIEKIHAYV